MILVGGDRRAWLGVVGRLRSVGADLQQCAEGRLGVQGGERHALGAFGHGPIVPASACGRGVGITGVCYGVSDAVGPTSVGGVGWRP